MSKDLLNKDIDILEELFSKIIVRFRSENPRTELDFVGTRGLISLVYRDLEGMEKKWPI